MAKTRDNYAHICIGIIVGIWICIITDMLTESPGSKEIYGTVYSIGWTDGANRAVDGITAKGWYDAESGLIVDSVRFQRLIEQK